MAVDVSGAVDTKPPPDSRADIAVFLRGRGPSSRRRRGALRLFAFIPEVCGVRTR